MQFYKNFYIYVAWCSANILSRKSFYSEILFTKRQFHHEYPMTFKIVCDSINDHDKYITINVDVIKRDLMTQWFILADIVSLSLSLSLRNTLGLHLHFTSRDVRFVREIKYVYLRHARE